MGFAVRDLAKAKAFYEAALKPLGLAMVREGEGWAAFGAGRHTEFWIGAYAAPPGRIHFAFVAKDRAAVDAFYAAAIAAGGKDNGSPGIRKNYHPGYYAAFVIDPTGTTSRRCATRSAGNGAFAQSAVTSRDAVPPRARPVRHRRRHRRRAAAVAAPGDAPVIAGHFGFAAGVKAAERQIPLWSLMLATAWLDVVFIPLFAAGIETITPVAGTSGGYGNGIIHADWTHSLVGALILSGIYGALFLRWGRRAMWVLAAVAFSHWLLDLIVHRGDMPILPGNIGGLPRLGLGLWQYPAVTAAVELALVVGGSWLYWRAARRTAVLGGASSADVAAGIVLASGLLVLLLDVPGIVG